MKNNQINVPMTFTRHNRIAMSHSQTVQYIAAITI